MEKLLVTGIRFNPFQLQNSFSSKSQVTKIRVNFVGSPIAIRLTLSLELALSVIMQTL